MKRTCIFSLVIIISCTQPTKNERATKPAIDSFVHHMNNKVQQYGNLGLWDSLDNYLNQLGDTVRQLHYDRLTFYWNLQKVQQLIGDNQFDSASKFMTKALMLLGSNSISYKDSFNLYIIHLHLVEKQQLYDSALHIANAALYLTRNDSFRICTISLELAQMYATLDDQDNARKYALRAWNFKDKAPELTNDIAKVMMFYYDKKDKTDSAIYYFKISQLNPAPYSNQPAAVASMYENTGLFLIERGRLQEGLQNILNAKHIVDSMGIKDAGFYNNLGDTYGKLKQYDKAFMYVDSAILIATKEKDYDLLSNAWNTKSEIYLNKSGYREAYAALDSSYNYNTLDEDSSLRKQARELETKYSVRNKDNQINSLALTNAANLRVRNQERITIITLIVAGIFLLIIGALLWRRQQMQTQLREVGLQQQQLRSQIQPHFIFNTLSILQGFIRNDEKDRAIQYLSKVAKLLRLSFENANESFVPLQKEVSALENYLQIQMINFENLFEYTITTYDGYEEDDILIPPMLLQPFVENSILHGFKNISHKGLITIQINKTTNVLHCIIEDNGHGFTDVDKSAREKLSSSIITQERLSIFAKQTGRKAKLVITNKKTINDGEGVKIEIELPFLRNHAG